VRLAATAGRLTIRACRSLGRPGGVLGGRVALAIDPRLLSWLAVDRSLALVSGTNGKSTTSAMLAAALGVVAWPAWNRTGANMPDGAVAALLDAPGADSAVLEIDEGYLPQVITATRPAYVLLLNLTRDQLDRVGEVAAVVHRIRAALLASPQTAVIGNAGDPLVVAAAKGAARQTWVDPAQTWRHDSVVCPLCGGHIDPAAPMWECDGCGLRRPTADWSVTAEGLLTGPDGSARALNLLLPGPANLINGACAIAAATAFGVRLDRAGEAVADLGEVAGRYRSYPRPHGATRLLLAKNPAGWSETLALLENASSAVVIAINAGEADGRDPSWLWDVPLERLRGRQVFASGARAADVAVRLTYAEVDHTVMMDPLAAAQSVPGHVDVAADYTAFVSLRARLASGTSSTAPAPEAEPAQGRRGDVR
jgi:UDP-N-acetylmuramyl tripeptide synthase